MLECFLLNNFIKLDSMMPGGINVIEYKCYTCNKEKGIVRDGAICPVCHERTKPVSKIYWSTDYNCPYYFDQLNDGTNLEYIGSDVRPVFPEERLLIEIAMDNVEPLEFLNKSVWSTASGVYFVNGKKTQLRVKDLDNLDPDMVIRQYNYYSEKNNYDYFNANVAKFVELNRPVYEQNDNEAINFVIDSVKELYCGDMFVSFSGGKDSTVTSDIVIRALGDLKIMHIFGNTTLEFPTTLDYVKRYKNSHPATPMIFAQNKEKNFEELCKLIGPPSRVMRWCCTVFKTGAITKKLDILYKKKNRVISFQGIRRMESSSRNKYDRISKSPKITKQVVLAPIINWTDFEVWLYILTRKIDFNDAYRLGYTRVGCWCCPNNSGWSMFLSKIHMNDEYNHFRNILIDFARSIDKKDAEVYVDSGKWKARQGGNGVEYGKKAMVKFEPCALEDNAFNYELSKPITSQLYELFKPFGKLNFDLGNNRLGEVYILDRNNVPLIKLSGRIGLTTLKVTIINLFGCKDIKTAESKIKCQLTKYQMCLNCTACPSICKYDAITIKGDNNISYTIDEEKCVHCGECVSHFTSGCYMRKVLATKKGSQNAIKKGKI